MITHASSLSPLRRLALVVALTAGTALAQEVPADGGVDGLPPDPGEILNPEIPDLTDPENPPVDPENPPIDPNTDPAADQDGEGAPDEGEDSPDGGEGLDPPTPATPDGEGPAFENPFAGRSLVDLSADLVTEGFEVPLTAFEIFPENVRGDIQTLVSELLPLLASGKEAELSAFFESRGNRIATVFDQLGLEPKAEALLAGPDRASSIKFPNEFENYESYLNSLDLQPFERDFMLRSHEIAEAYEDDLLAAHEDHGRLQSALEDYREKLETLNERYAEQFREQFLESIDRAAPDGGRPDVDR